jgi:mono/diheme cytochrome c family protein
MKPARVVWASVIVLVLSVVSSGVASTQATGPKIPPLAIPSMAGRDLFGFYCASCHGRDGKGGGPIAQSLKTPPSDLTTIARRRGSAFPTRLVESRLADGGTLSTGAHGSTDMPVWGPIFRSLDPRDTVTRVRIANIVEYVESIQVK